MIHLDQGGRYNCIMPWFDSMFNAGMLPIDAIGLSFYSFWHGTFMDLKDTMSRLIKLYNLPVYIVETAHPWRHCKEIISRRNLWRLQALMQAAQSRRSLLK